MSSAQKELYFSAYVSLEKWNDDSDFKYFNTVCCIPISYQGQ